MNQHLGISQQVHMLAPAMVEADVAVLLKRVLQPAVGSKHDRASLEKVI
jgi:hypothetical protein